MRGAERIVPVDIGQACQLPREALLVGLFFLVEAQVLEEEHLALFELAGELLHAIADAVVRQDHLVGLPSSSLSFVAAGSSESAGSAPFGRPRCDARMG